MIGYVYSADKLSGDKLIPPLGEWQEYHGSSSLKFFGLSAHTNHYTALKYAKGHLLHKVELAGEIYKESNSIFAERRRFVATIDVTELMYEFARGCAWGVIDQWGAPEVVLEYLESGEEFWRLEARAEANKASKLVGLEAAAAWWATERGDTPIRVASSVTRIAWALGDDGQASTTRLQRMIIKAFTKVNL